jgi:diaminobutyrate-2-oxoglutarate transaminase
MNDREQTAEAQHGPLHVFDKHESDVRSYVRAFPVVFDRARGSRLYDEDGQPYLDFFSGAGALNYGHNHPELKQGLLDYLVKDGITHSLDMATCAKRRFIERFQSVVLEPRKLDYKMMFPGPTGTNAVEAALKLARKATGRRTIFAFRGGFHGMTLGALAITSNKMKREGAGQPLDYTRLLPFDGDTQDGLDSLTFLQRELTRAAERAALPAAVVLETVQCEGGVRVASSEWLRKVADACRTHGVLLVVDDIQAGCGRTGSFFSFDGIGVEPDIVCLSKSLSGLGIPLSLVLLRAELDVFSPGEHNGTFRGHNLAFVTATRALEFWSDRGFERSVQAKALLLRHRLEALAESHDDGITVRGRGMVQGLVFEDASLAGAVARACFERHLVIETAGHEDQVLKFLPALTMDVASLEEGIRIVEESLRVVAAERASEPALV